MVVLAASIITKTGRALVSRQFVDMSRIRIEGLLAAFPKLVGTGQQHTYVETENVRYVYQPLDKLYLLLVTNRGSNILEDLDILRLLAKVLPEHVAPMEEERVAEAAYDLLFVFDEAISLGYKEHITVAQIKQNMAMSSHEEVLHRMIIQNKIDDAVRGMKSKATEIDRRKAEKKQDRLALGGPGAISAPAPAAAPKFSPLDSDTPTYSRPAANTFGKAEPAAPAGGPRKGMQLGKAKKANDFLASLQAEGEAVSADAPPVGLDAPAPGAPPPAPPSKEDPVALSVEEKLAILVDKDAGLDSMEVQGVLMLHISREDMSQLRVVVATDDSGAYQFKTHPRIDKGLYAEAHTLGLRDPAQAFPLNTPQPILKWRRQVKEGGDDELPLKVSCWPSREGPLSCLNLEYEATVGFDLLHVTIAIPCASAPKIAQIDGDSAFDARRGILTWAIDLLDASNRTGSLEFRTAAQPDSAFFPIQVHFDAKTTLCKVDLVSVVHAESGEALKYGARKSLYTEDYTIT